MPEHFNNDDNEPITQKQMAEELGIDLANLTKRSEELYTFLQDHNFRALEMMLVCRWASELATKAVREAIEPEVQKPAMEDLNTFYLNWKGMIT